MRRGARRLLIAGGIAAGVLAAAVVGVEVLLPHWLRGAIERFGSDGLARRVTVGGPVELSLLPEPVLSIRDVALANAAWGTEPDMVRVGRLSVRLGLRALLSGRLLLRDVAIERVRVSLERDEHGTGNWVLAIPRRPSHAKEKKAWKPVTIERASVRDLALALRKRPRSDPLRVSVRTLTARLDPADQMVDLEVEGSLDEAPWQLAGRLGTLNNLYAARDVEHTLTGRIAGSTVTLQGRIRDPLSLGGAEVTLGVEGGDAAAAAEVFGLRIPVTGPYRIDATLAPIAEGGVATRIAAEAGGMKASARGQVSALLDPARIGATLEIEGPDASVPGGWLGIAGLPPRPFEAGGTVRREGSSVVLDGMRLRVGETSATIDGTVGPPPRCEGTSLAIRGAGKDLSQLSALTRLSLPAVPFGVTGRFLRRPDGLAIERAEVRAGATTVQADGTIGEPPSLTALDLRAEARGPDASVLNSLAGVALPRAPFAAHGRIAREGRAYALDAVEIEMGADRASVRGAL
ncbi:MAG TPA: AsmA family protein, partial [Candidatus Polarisedimenticolaceae bacterium]|nr:AsmA family protein [Candidatus Polarisedimenticolaceae bacterium]